MRKLLLIPFLLTISACGGRVELPTPVVQLPEPPAELMEPPKPLNTIGNNTQEPE